ncbi:serine-type endopeptidase [Aureococcus anophagefferens]|nr:serine-type endopeptidase [Aureococcus anophagefferens]
MDLDGSNGAYAGKLGAGLVDAEAFVACVGEGADPRPTPRPTPPPSVEPDEPPPKPEDLKFVVEYQTNHDETWTRVDKGRSYVSEVDGRFYQPIHAPCLTKGRVRVTAVDHGDSAAAYSDIFKMGAASSARRFERMWLRLVISKTSIAHLAFLFDDFCPKEDPFPRLKDLQTAMGKLAHLFGELNCSNTIDEFTVGVSPSGARGTLATCRDGVRWITGRDQREIDVYLASDDDSDGEMDY